MAIDRVSGAILKSDLDRQGIDLQFSTSGQPLLYLDFANFRAAINANADNTSSTFTVNGNVDIGHLHLDNTTISSIADITIAPSNNLYLGNASSIKISGGSPNYILVTDGSGNLSWQNLGQITNTMSLTGMNVTLSTPSDQSSVDYVAYRYWQSTTTITDAVDNLNQVMLNVYQNTYVGAVDFTANIVSGPSPLTVQFTSTILGNPNTYHWDFGDGTVGTTANPIHTYTNALGGIFSVYFKASNSAGTLGGAGSYGHDVLGQAQGSYADLLKANYITMYTPSPVPLFTLNTHTLNNLDSIQLTNISQYATSYIIQWGDGTTTPVSNNSVPGGVGGGPILHTYTNVAGDATYNITLSAYSATAGIAGLTITTAPTSIAVYSSQTPTFSANVTIGNNQHSTTPNGLIVGFTNTTTTAPGPTATYYSNEIVWNFGDGNTANVAIGSGSSGDLGQTIAHAYTLVNPKVGQIFNATMQIYNGNSSSPFTSPSTAITVVPAPTSLFIGNATIPSDRIGDTPQTGYMFTDLSGNNRGQISFNNQSFNTDMYTWSYGDGASIGPIAEGNTGTPTGSPITHTYTASGDYTVTLLAHGGSSINANDDTLVKNNYITILPAPAAPTGLSTRTLTITSSGTSPLLAAYAIDNSGGSIPAAGTSVYRVTTQDPIATSSVLNVYNAYSGTLSALVNGTIAGNVSLTGANDTGNYGALNISSDVDAHTVDATLWPSNFYNVFSGNISNTNTSISIGYNTYQMSHSLTGSTNVMGFVKDDVTTAPVLDISTITATATTLGSMRYISGVPYFNTGGVVSITQVNAYNWIGQTYLGTTNPMTLTPGATVEGSGSAITAQGITYSHLDGPTTYLNSGIPKAETGNVSAHAYSLGAIPVTINGSSASASKISLTLSNVNGTSPTYICPTIINTYSVPITGFNELNIPVSTTLGGTYTDNGLRVYIAGALGATPTYSSALNYYINSPFVGNQTVSGTDEAIVRFGTLAHNITNYSLYLPAGPDLSGRSGPQYFRFAFRRTAMANFTVTYSGQISGLWIAAPGSNIDNASTLNGWVDATLVYAGAGCPGANTLTGGNGSNGCAKSAGDVIPVGQLVTRHACLLTLGTANSSDAYGNEILVSIEIQGTDTVTSISIS